MTLNNTLNLTNLTHQELQNLRHIIGSHQVMAKKFEDYSNKCQDSQIKQLFKQSGQAAQTTAQNLLNSL